MSLIGPTTSSSTTTTTGASDSVDQNNTTTTESTVSTVGTSTTTPSDGSSNSGQTTVDSSVNSADEIPSYDDGLNFDSDSSSDDGVVTKEDQAEWDALVDKANNGDDQAQKAMVKMIQAAVPLAPPVTETVIETAPEQTEQAHETNKEEDSKDRPQDSKQRLSSYVSDARKSLNKMSELLKTLPTDPQLAKQLKGFKKETELKLAIAEEALHEELHDTGQKFAQKMGPKVDPKAAEAMLAQAAQKYQAFPVKKALTLSGPEGVEPKEESAETLSNTKTAQQKLAQLSTKQADKALKTAESQKVEGDEVSKQATPEKIIKAQEVVVKHVGVDKAAERLQFAEKKEANKKEELKKLARLKGLSTGKGDFSSMALQEGAGHMYRATMVNSFKNFGKGLSGTADDMMFVGASAVYKALDGKEVDQVVSQKAHDILHADPTDQKNHEARQALFQKDKEIPDYDNAPGKTKSGFLGNFKNWGFKDKDGTAARIQTLDPNRVA